jgi:allophanate hydrolase subunit 2
MMPALRVQSPGLMTTVQDLGRVGYQHLGVPVSGALDPVSLRAANLLVGNPPDTAALEIAYQGPVLAVEADSVRIALAGGSAPVEIVSQEGDGSSERLGPLQSVRLRRGQVVRIGALAGSAVTYLAVEGGFDIASVLGSRST